MSKHATYSRDLSLTLPDEGLRKKFFGSILGADGKTLDISGNFQRLHTICDGYVGHVMVDIIIDELVECQVEGDAFNYAQRQHGIVHEVKAVLKKGAAGNDKELLKDWLASHPNPDESHKGFGWRSAIRFVLTKALHLGMLQETGAENLVFRLNASDDQKTALALYWATRHKSGSPYRCYLSTSVGPDGEIYVSRQRKRELASLNSAWGSLCQGQISYSIIPIREMEEGVAEEIEKLEVSTEAKKSEWAANLADPQHAEEAKEEIARLDKFLAALPSKSVFLHRLCDMLPHCHLYFNVSDLDSRLRQIIGESYKNISVYSWKFLRAHLASKPEPLTEDELHFVYKMVNEIAGSRQKTRKLEVAMGKKLLTAFAKGKALPSGIKRWERILLQRYVEFYRLWLQDPQTPFNAWVEVDQTAEVMATYSVLFGLRTLAELTNIINNHGRICDAWSVGDDGPYGSVEVIRAIWKLVGTPVLYGASGNWKDLVESAVESVNADRAADEQIVVTDELIKRVAWEFGRNGRFGVIMRICKFICDRMKTRAAASGYRESFGLEEGDSLRIEGCHIPHNGHYDRHTCEGDKELDNTVYATDMADGVVEPNNSGDLVVKEIMTTPEHEVKVMIGWKQDLKAMNRFWPTALIHRIGAWVTQYVLRRLAQNKVWFFNIHDAYLVHPKYAGLVEKYVQEAYMELHAHRCNILEAWFQSVLGCSYRDLVVFVRAGGYAIDEDFLEAMDGGYNARA